MFVLDTNVLSELRPGRARVSPAVTAWSKTVPVEALYLTAVTVLEIERGLLQFERRAPQDAGALRGWFDGMRGLFAGRVLPFTEDAAVRCAAMHVPDPAPERDSMIAAIALEHGMTLVTRNVKDFERTGVRLFNPWGFQP
ncbi:MAG: type II toxin-antitoxin system VapC family toxin [Pirellulales bacterium]